MCFRMKQDGNGSTVPELKGRLAELGVEVQGPVPPRHEHVQQVQDVLRQHEGPDAAPQPPAGDERATEQPAGDGRADPEGTVGETVGRPRDTDVAEERVRHVQKERLTGDACHIRG